MALNNLPALPQGLWPVMLTPFNENGSIDYETLITLTNYYINSGSAGLFVNCLSSEMYHLTPKERVDLTRSVVEIVDTRIPVVSTGTFRGTIESQVNFINKIYSAGATAVIIVTSNITDQQDDDHNLLSKLKQISNKTGDIPLGVYECPNPYKRLVPPEIIKWLSESGRFIYYKDTSCNLNDIKGKLDVIGNSSGLKLYNANTTTGLDSLRLGANGLSPISANFYPELYVYLIENFDNDFKTDEIKYLHRMLTLMDAVTHNITYPLSAKIFLRSRGLPIKTKVRVQPKNINYEEERFLENLYEIFKIVSDKLHIDIEIDE